MPLPANNQPRAVVYTRFSPRSDAATCKSCESQYAEAVAYCARHNYLVVDHYPDPDVSGDDADRPTLYAAISTLRRGWRLIVYDCSRLARNQYLAESLRQIVEKRGATIEYVSGANGDTPEAVLIRQVLQAMAEYERRIKAARTSAGMKRNQKAGRVQGSRLPYGYRFGDSKKVMIPDDAEQAVIARMRRSKKAGSSLRGIAKELNAAGTPCRGAKGWTATNIKRILEREGE